MAQFVEVEIEINGKNIKQYSSLSITQTIFEHHVFSLICPAEAIDGTSGGILNTSRDMIGGKISIQIKAVESSGVTKFIGVVTQVEAARQDGYVGDVVITGYSPTIVLDNGVHCKSWEKKAVKNIAQDVLKHFPRNLLQPQINPTYGETLSYTVQYKECAWQFLGRLSSTYGEWFYYDGEKLILGKPQGSKAQLVFGRDLDSFNMILQVRPPKFQLRAYDYMNHQVYNGQPAEIAGKAGLNDLGKFTLDKSEQFYDATPKQWHNNFLTNKKQLDDYVNIRASMQSSNMVRFNGHSGNPGIQVGGTVSVKGKNVYADSDESYGDYTVVSANHYCDGEGYYSNDFVAIPSTVKMPPAPYIPDPRCETQSAIVTDNNDPNGLGRVRVRFHWMWDFEKSPWLRVTSPHGGDGKGMFFVPEIGEEVIVGFEGDSPTKPYIIGTVYHGKAKSSFGNGGNDIKALQTRSGNFIILNDSEGSIHIADSKGNDMKLDGQGNINITSTESIVLTCGSAKLEMQKDGTINITGKKEIVIDGTSGPITLQSDKTITTDASQGALVKSDTKVQVGAPKIDVKADGILNMNATSVSVNGDAMTNISGGILNLNS